MEQVVARWQPSLYGLYGWKSVSKRHFKRAVKRNRVKRQLREAYRLSKQLLYDKLEQVPQRAVVIAFIWLSDELYSTAEVIRCIEILMKRLTEKL